MIRRCQSDDFETIFLIINDAAQAYRGIIPADRWHEPYMARQELRHEIDSGVVFWGSYDDHGTLLGVMGLQDVQDVTLIRHAYVLTTHRNQGIGGQILTALRPMTDRPLLIGTWLAADWAIRFYEKHGFRALGPKDSARLLRKYWSIPERQLETSLVLTEDGFEG